MSTRPVLLVFVPRQSDLDLIVAIGDIRLFNRSSRSSDLSRVDLDLELLMTLFLPFLFRLYFSHPVEHDSELCLCLRYS